MSDIKLKGLSVYFTVASGTVKAVDQVDMLIKEGEITGIIGESGCGKSVLGMALLGLLPSYAKVSGEIWYKEQNLLTLNSKDRRLIRGREIGFIAQNPAGSLNPVLKVKGQLLEALRLRGGDKKNEEAQLSTLLQSFGFTEAEAARVENAYSFELSGGMQQRVIAAMGLASGPRWVLADEPSKGLDAELRGQMYSTLRLAKEKTSGILIITHDLALASTLCNSVAVMYSGEIVEKGKSVLISPKHPYTRGLINSLPGKDMKVMEGIAPSPGDSFPGCKFAPRCPSRLERCERERPRSFGDEGEMVRCFLYA